MTVADWIQELGSRLAGRAGTWVVTTVLGVALTLGYWTCTGSSGGSDSLDQIPEAFFEGGDTYSVDLDVNQPAWLHVSVQREDRDTNEYYLEAREALDPGAWTVEFEAPPDTLIYFDLSFKDPQPGAETRWAIQRNGSRIWSESNVMGPDYPEHWGFGLQLEPEQWTQPPSWY